MQRYASLRQGLVGAWCPSVSGPFGYSLPDLSGYGGHGTLTNMASDDWVVNGGKRALDFDGSNDHVRCTRQGLAVRGSVSVWLNSSSTASGRTAVVSTTNFGSQASSYNFVIGVTSTGLTQSYVFDGTQKRASGETISTGVWTHCCLTFVDNDSFKFYTSGIFRNSTALGTAGSNRTWVWQLGSNSGVTGTPSIGLYWLGFLDDFRIYNRALTESEIRLLASERGIGLKPERQRNRYLVPVTTSSRNRSSRFLGFPA